MNDRTARLIYVGGTLLCLGASSASAQAGYPPPAQPQPAYPPGAYAQPVQQPAPAPQPQYQQPAPQPAYQQPAYQQPAPVAPAPQPQYAQPQPQYAQPQPQYAQPSPAPGYAPQPDPYAQPQGMAPAPMPEAAPETAGAMPDGTVDGAVQLGLATTLVSYQPVSLEGENNGGKANQSELKWGIGDNPIAIEIGYGITPQLVFGGLVGLGGNSTTFTPDGGTDQKQSAFGLEIGPKLDFMFSPGAKANPFIGAEALVRLDSEDFGGGSKRSTTIFIFLARVGLRAFLADSFSIDPSLVVGGGVGSGSNNAGGGAADSDFSVSGFRIGLNIAASGWIQ